MSNLLLFPTSKKIAANLLKSTTELERHCSSEPNIQQKCSSVDAGAVARRSRAIARIRTHKGHAKTDNGVLPDAAPVIANALRWVHRRGRHWTALPAAIRTQMDQLCGAGDPAAVLVRDWIMCRHPEDISEALKNEGRA
jgi:hypothetical protein